MPLTAFSFTAPVITEEQEKKELEALSNAEREEIDRDVTGKHVDDYVETPAMIQRGLLEFMEALEQIPEENKVDYLMARDVCPELVQRESSPLAFLRRDMFDPWAASQRFTRYWKARRKLFGERAFLPLTITGDGALPQDTLDCLAMGHAMILPDDKKGRGVLYYDRMLYNVEDYRTHQLRDLMYLVTVQLEKENVQKNGFVVLISSRDIEHDRFDRKFVKMYYELSDALPFHVRAVHLCLPANKCVCHLVLPALKFLMDKEVRKRHRFHAGDPSETMKMLLEYHFERSMVPTRLGGDWEMSQWSTWLDERRSHEMRLLEGVHN